jgi:hypothetical protein
MRSLYTFMLLIIRVIPLHFSADITTPGHIAQIILEETATITTNPVATRKHKTKLPIRFWIRDIHGHPIKASPTLFLNLEQISCSRHYHRTKARTHINVTHTHTSTQPISIQDKNMITVPKTRFRIFRYRGVQYRGTQH